MSECLPLTDELMGLVVHDLKNPLAALLANLGFVRSAVGGDESTREAVDDCLLSTEVLSRLIDNLSALARFTGVEASLGGEASVEPALTSVEARMRRHAEAAGLALEASMEPGCGSVGVGAASLELALDNLVSASLAYAPTGSTVRLSARRDGDVVSLVVADDGPAVSEEHRATLSDLEGQLELKGAHGARYARGLGLHVAALVARRGGGSLDVESPTGGGCALELRLPARG